MSVVKILHIIIGVIESLLDGTLRSSHRCCLLEYMKSLTPPQAEETHRAEIGQPQ